MTDHNDRLRALGRHLDAEAPPVTGDEARHRAAPPPRRSARPWAGVAVAAAAALLVLGAVAALGLFGDDGATSVRTTPATTPDQETTAASTTTTTVRASSSSTSTSTDPGGGLPGERMAAPPAEGSRLAVVGVAADDVLNVREGPGTEFRVLFTLHPLSEEAVATGHNRLITGRGLWSEVRADGLTGWARTEFLLQPGQVDDVTARLFPSPGTRPSASSLTEVASVVADAVREGEDGSSTPRFVIVDGPTAGDLGEVTFDLLGLADDAVGGLRLKVFAERDDAGGRYTVRTVEQTVLCRRAVTDDGLCA